VAQYGQDSAQTDAVTFKKLEIVNFLFQSLTFPVAAAFVAKFLGFLVSQTAYPFSFS